MATKVIAQSLEGDMDDMQEHYIEDDFVIVCDGTCRIEGAVAYANGTVVLTIKGRR